MAKPTIEQLRYVTTEMAKVAIEEMAHPDNRRNLKALMHDWFPDADEMDLRWAADGVALGLGQVNVLLSKRRQRLIDEGHAEMPT